MLPANIALEPAARNWRSCAAAQRETLDRQPTTLSVEWHLRLASASDRDFLYALRVARPCARLSRRRGGDEAWQRTDFENRLAPYVVSIIEADNRPAGSLWLEWKPNSMYIHEVQILSARIMFREL
jgi:hypothetical protein